MKSLQNGFSLIEVMVAGSIMAGMGYYIMTQSESVNKLQSKITFNQELSSVTNQIQTMLAIRANCSVTVVGKKVGDSLTDIKYGIDDPISPLTNPAIPDRVFLAVDQQVGGQGFQIKEIKIVEKRDSNNTLIGDAIRVSFRAGRVGSDGVFIPIKTSGATDVNKDFLLNGEKLGTGEYKNCYSEAGNLVETSTVAACTSIGAQWDNVTKKCKLTNLPNCLIVEGGACGSLYTEVGQYNWDVRVYGRRLCTTTYEMGLLIGKSTKYRSCHCTGTSCNCSNGDMRHYATVDHRCVEDPQLREISAKRCCRP